MRDDLPGRAPEDALDYRLDSGPPPASGVVKVQLLSIPLEKVVEFFRKIFRR
jgi:hypothetical protein